jgi:hypothetical protein
MDPDTHTDIETRTFTDRSRRRVSRAPWDPPPRQAKPGAAPKRTAAGKRRVDEPAVLGGFYDDLGRGVD